MAILTDKLLVLHCPRTGGRWIREALVAGGVAYSEVGTSWHSYGSDVGWWRRRGRIVVAVARDPMSWWGSVWCFQEKHGWPEWPGHPNEAGAHDFGQFVANVLERCPGHYARVLARYCDPADEVVPFESLRDSFAELLAHHEVPFNREKLLAVEPVGEADAELVERANLAGELGDRLVAVEAEALRGKWYAPIVLGQGTGTELPVDDYLKAQISEGDDDGGVDQGADPRGG